jgi:hypothetical protein
MGSSLIGSFLRGRVELHLKHGLIVSSAWFKLQKDTFSITLILGLS